MKNSLFLILSLAFCCLLQACSNDRYQIDKDKSGRTIRLDKKTGEMALIEDGQIKKLTEADMTAAYSPPDPRTLNTISLKHVGADSATCKSQWRDNYIYMIVDIWPIPSAYTNFITHKPRDVAESLRQDMPFTLYLYDESGFEIEKDIINRAEILRIVDDRGNTTCLRINLKIYASLEIYTRTVNWAIAFNF